MKVQPLAKGDFEITLKTEASSLLFSDKGIANQLLLTPKAILRNVQAIQQRNGLAVSTQLESCAFKLSNEDVEEESNKTGEVPLNFTIEMETWHRQDLRLFAFDLPAQQGVAALKSLLSSYRA